MAQDNQHIIVSLLIYDDYVVLGLDSVNILVQGNGQQDEDFHTYQQVSCEEMDNAFVIRNVFLCCRQVSDEHGNHSGGVNLGIFSFLCNLRTMSSAWWYKALSTHSSYKMVIVNVPEIYAYILLVGSEIKAITCNLHIIAHMPNPLLCNLRNTKIKTAIWYTGILSSCYSTTN